MLRSISSFRAFKWAYGNNNITYLTIIDFLILNIISPRSLIYSVKKINEHLKNLKKYYKQKSIVESRSNELYLKLKKLKADEISEYGLHEFVKIFIKDLSNITNDLYVIIEANTVFPGKQKDFYDNTEISKKYFQGEFYQFSIRINI